MPGRSPTSDPASAGSSATSADQDGNALFHNPPDASPSAQAATMTTASQQHSWTAPPSYFAAEGPSFEDDYEMPDFEDGGAPLVTQSEMTAYLLDPEGPIAESFSPMTFDAEAHDDLVSDSDFTAQSLSNEMMHLPAPTGPAPPLHSQYGTALTPPTMNPLDMIEQLQELQSAEPETMVDVAGLHPAAMNPHMSLGPENPELLNFLRTWAWHGRGDPAEKEFKVLPNLRQINSQLANTNIRRVEYGDLRGDRCDYQGVDWADMGVSRRAARARRRETYKNYVNKPGSDFWRPKIPDMVLPACEDYFRFRRMDIRRDVRLLHFQLRNILGSVSRSRAFYPSSTSSIREVDPTTGRTKIALDFEGENDVQISTLSALDDILIVGGFLGDYRYRRLDTDDGNFAEGRLTTHISGITNHVQVHPSRSSGPMAAFASNDHGFRVVDLTTNQIISEREYNTPLNCTTLSMDRRLRAMVGDQCNVLITDAETGEIVQDLSGHRDFGFACDWAPNGWTVATGNQDKSIRIWDARKWRSNSTGEAQPVAVIRTELSGARSLRFSPLGSGKRVLVAAEEADVINIIDAQTFETKQTVEVFGEISGTAFADDGQNLLALVADRHRGGLLQLERCDAGAEDCFDYTDRRRSPWWQTRGYDWIDTPDEAASLPGSQTTLTQHRRQATVLGNLDPF